MQLLPQLEIVKTGCFCPELALLFQDSQLVLVCCVLCNIARLKSEIAFTYHLESVGFLNLLQQLDQNLMNYALTLNSLTVSCESRKQDVSD